MHFKERFVLCWLLPLSGMQNKINTHPQVLPEGKRLHDKTNCDRKTAHLHQKQN